jgi:putative acetyltransferase
MTLAIRKATPADAERLFDIWHSAVEATHDFVSPADHAEIAELVRDQYLPEADLDLAVDENDLPLAFMGMTGNEIDALFVHASARGTGVGRFMVEHACRQSPVILTEVNEQNGQGVAFWEHMGFRRTGRTEVDGQGRPYPLLQMEWRAEPAAL